MHLALAKGAAGAPINRWVLSFHHKLPITGQAQVALLAAF